MTEPKEHPMPRLASLVAHLLVWFRIAYVPMLLLMGVATGALVVKAGMYAWTMLLDLKSESLGRMIYYSLALLDATLVIGLLMMVMGYVLFNFVLDKSSPPELIPDWCRERFMNKGESVIKAKIGVTILLIATIDLLGEFVALSDVNVDEIDAVSSRLWLMLGLFLALAITAAVLIAVVRLTDSSKGH